MKLGVTVLPSVCEGKRSGVMHEVHLHKRWA